MIERVCPYEPLAFYVDHLDDYTEPVLDTLHGAGEDYVGLHFFTGEEYVVIWNTDAIWPDLDIFDAAETCTQCIANACTECGVFGA